jgi:rSAM/selenodomain-associated transferase 2
MGFPFTRPEIESSKECSAPKISIIIPAVNEAQGIGDTLAAIQLLSGDFEIIVVDGGSSDRTVAIARAMGVQVIESAQRGRASQMNLGARQARGDVFLFLHADTRLPPDACSAIARALARPGVIGGCFRLAFDHDHPVLRVSGFLSRFAFRLFHYGDAAYFVRREVFFELNGFRMLPLMEDLDFWLRLNRRHRTAITDATVLTSARRFREHGVIRQQSQGLMLVTLFLLGVAPSRLASIYYGRPQQQTTEAR